MTQGSAMTTTPRPCFPWKIHKKPLETVVQAQGKSPTLPLATD